MTSLFCRHNRLTVNCPICSRELEQELRDKAPPRPPGSRPARPARGTAKRDAASQSIRARRAAARAPGGVVRRRLARAEDDGYRNALVPGLRATADAERLAGALLLAAERLEFPGPYEEVADEADLEQASWIAFLVAVAGPDAPQLQDDIFAAAPSWADADTGPLPAEHDRAVEAYRQWAERAGSQAAGYTGDTTWSPTRRFARVFERLSLPGLTRAARFELLTALGAAERYELAPETLQLGPEDDPTTSAAKRVLQSGDRMLLERRARDLAAAADLPLAALDRGLAIWGAPGVDIPLAGELPARVVAALRLG